MNKILFTLCLFLVSTIAYSQINYTESQLFGSSRGNWNSYDFGKITTNVIQHEFVISNTNKVPLTISSVEIPDGFGVIVVDRVIPAESVGKIIIMIYKDYVNPKGDFNQKVFINTEYESISGKTQNQISFEIKGSI